MEEPGSGPSLGILVMQGLNLSVASAPGLVPGSQQGQPKEGALPEGEKGKALRGDWT